MKIGISAFAWTRRFGMSHLDLLPKLSEHGLSGLEIPMFDPSDLATTEIRRAFAANHLDATVCAILPVGINPIDPDIAIRNRSFAHLVRCVEATAQLGARLLGGPLFAPIGYLPGRRRNNEEWKWAVDIFRALGAVLDAHEIMLSIEPVNRSETFFLNTAQDAKEFCDAIAHPRVGVTIDTFHANIEEKNIAGAIQSLGKLLTHVHASENDRGLLGTGHVNFREIVEALRRISYDGYLVIEGFGYDPKEKDSLGALWGDLAVTPEHIAFHGAQYLSSLLNRT